MMTAPFSKKEKILTMYYNTIGVFRCIHLFGFALIKLFFFCQFHICGTSFAYI